MNTKQFNVGVTACAKNVEKCNERSHLKRNKGKHALKASCQPAKLPTSKMARPEEFSAPKNVTTTTEKTSSYVIQGVHAPKFKVQVKLVSSCGFQVLNNTWIKQFRHLLPWLMGAVETRHVASSSWEATI